MATLNREPTTILQNGAKMPLLGLGVAQIPDGPATIHAIHWAFAAGYRHIDTAKMYGNERGVGEAVRTSSLPRDDLWVTTKLLPADSLNVKRAFEGSLAQLGLAYIDLYLVHWPVPDLVIKTWKQMEALYEEGHAKAIGVSKYNIRQLEQILNIASVPPAVNQVRCSPFDFDKPLYAFCQKHHIAFEAYSPLTRGQQLHNETLNRIAKNYR